MTTVLFSASTLGRCGLAVLIFLAGCAGVPTSARVELDSKSIAYFLRPGPGPAVVFQSGLGDGKSVWQKVINQLPASAPVFAYDRPGYGDSPVASATRDPCTISRELHELLGRAGLAPPYILVGHSLGGLYQYCYARLYPDEVAGLVLLDPTHPHHWEKMKADATVQAALVQSLRMTAFSRVMRQEFDAQTECLDGLDTGRPLANSVRLLFSGQFRLTEKGAFETMARELREQWLTQFSSARHTEVSGSGHYLQKDAPGAVADAIRELAGDPADQ